MEEIVFSNGARAIPTELQDCLIIEPHFFSDERGYYVTDFIKEDFKKLGFEDAYQHSESRSAKNVLRGMHYQLDPKCQAKLVRVVVGEAIDIVVDIRVGSPSYGKAIAVHLTKYDKNVPGSGKQLYVPRGFAHGFLSLKDETYFQYFVDNSYAPELEDGILWNGEETKELFEDVFREYGIDVGDLIISEKDKVRLPLKEKGEQFTYKPKMKKLENYNFDVGV